MGRFAKGPRLWLHPERKDSTGKVTHQSTWIILDGSRRVRTGCPESERSDAENKLLAYIEGQPTERTVVKYVYFITTEHEGFPVKIGISESHHARFTTLQVALPYRVKVLAVLPTQDAIFERRLHRKFAHLRLEGEWFERAPDLLAYIETLVNETRAA